MTKNKNIILDAQYPSSQEKRKEHIDKITATIINSDCKLSLSRDELYLVLDEAITNAMEHGNKWNSQKKVHIIISLNSKHLYVDIIDEGDGFNTKIYEQNLKNRNILSIRGRGLFIINQFCNLSWNKKGNKLTLEIQIENEKTN